MGGRDEATNGFGLAHDIEHMLFMGTLTIGRRRQPR